MKIYKKTNVWDAARQRMDMIFDEFETVIVFVSGGKDSTVLMELALEAARRKSRLPLKVAFLDQEAEWESTETYIERTFQREGIEPYWFQVPFRLFNSSSYSDDWLKCWDPEQEANWVHPQNPIAIKRNVFGTDRFKELFPRLGSAISGMKPYAAMSGMRAQESGIRRLAVTRAPYFKGVTWSSMHGPHGTMFYPIYDWTVDDIWIAISRNGWDYNPIYDSMYRYGVSVRKMRCSSLIHETSAEHNLVLLQEIEPKTYERLAARIGGVDTYSKLMKEVRQYKLPAAFATWKEYCGYLHDTILTPQGREGFDSLVKQKDFKENAGDDEFWRAVAIQMQANDYTGTKMANMLRAYTHRRAAKRKYGYGK